MVPLDDDFLDRLWQAAIELVVDCGVLCIDEQRIIEFTEREVRDCIDSVPSQVTLGRDADAVTIPHRGFEDYDHVKVPPYSRGRILGPISSDLYEKVAWSFANEPLIDYVDFQGVLTEVNSLPVKPSSPWEMMAEMKSIGIVKEVLRRAGRPGMCDGGMRTITTMGQMAGYDTRWGTNTGDLRCCLLTPHQKVDYDHLCRAIMWHSHGILIWGAFQCYIGGLSGGPEHSVVTATAEFILNQLLFAVTIDGPWPVDALYFSNTSKYSQWCANYSAAAVMKNTHCPSLMGGGWQMTAGIGCEEFFWESAVSAISSTVLGCGVTGGTGHQSGGRDHACGLGMRFSVEVGRAVAKARLTRKDANELVVRIMSKYQPQIDARTLHKKGGDFRECYDLDTVKPNKEYYAMYNKVKRELREMGLPMEVE
jgi:methylamine--corrinoid protein Co-methyltransferase